jgi:hypothetical protein
MKTTVFWVVTLDRFVEGLTFSRNMFPKNKMTDFYRTFKAEIYQKAMVYLKPITWYVSFYQCLSSAH